MILISNLVQNRILLKKFLFI